MVTVRACDYAGNVGQRTTVVRFDTLSPQVSIVSPGQGAVLRNPVDIVVTTDPDVTAVTASGGVPMIRQPGTNLWKATIHVTEFEGVFSIDAQDAAGNIGSANWYGRIDDSGPTVATVTPARQARLQGTFTTTLSDVQDVSGVARAELWSNGRYVGVDTAAPYSLPVKTGTYSGTPRIGPGRRRCRSGRNDKVGNVRYASTRTWYRG
ncbi:Ig-like domain-containing protein [Krasilnikovia sp. MM14-A1259]|uniref:Ig-like domain-containing protein n=1 Tax=Krasilnikovia sp. MM14-A1259 TaxID=3373539 RepID=UPI00399CC0E9